MSATPPDQPAPSARAADLHRAGSVLKALAHRERLAIVAMLGGGEMRVGAIADALGLAMPVVSQHLSRLFAAGVVRRRRDSTSAFYSLDPATLADLRELLARLADPVTSLAGGDSP